MSTPLVFIIILNWNGRHLLQDCLDSLSSLDYPNYKILLVDNNSQDGSLNMVVENYPHVLTISNNENLGFSEGNNVGIRYALAHGAMYVVLLNNDTRVEPDFLSHLVRRGEEAPDVGVLGGKLLMFYDPLVVNSTGVNLNRYAYGWDRDFGEDSTSLQRAGGQVLAVSGCLMAIKRGVLEQIGLLDAKFFAYFEDVDFCLRVWGQTGFTVEYVPEAVVYHKFSASAGASSPFKRSLMMKNRYRVFFKHFPITQILNIFPRLTLHRLYMLLRYPRRVGLSLFLMEPMVLLKYWLALPVLLLRRGAQQSTCEHADSFWKMIIPEMQLPPIRAYKPGYGRAFLNQDEFANP